MLIKGKNKKGQEEIVGFVIIVIIVSVILLFFLVFSLSSNRENEESYEASSFLQSTLAYTSTCESGSEFMPVDELIASCYNEERCDNEEYSCDVLNETLTGLLEESRPVGPDFKVKGYKFEAVSGEETIISISKGNVTSSYKGSQQLLPVAEGIRVSFTAYY